MMKKALFPILVCLILSGCLETKEIQSIAYAISMGVDYKEEQFELTVQFLDFSNVAKTDQGQSGTAPVWLAVGRGETIEEAISDIYRTIQLPINYEHLYNIVLSPTVLEEKINETLDTITEGFLIPYTAWIYSTTLPMQDVLASKVIFNYAFLYSRLTQPEDMQIQLSSIPTLFLQDFRIDMHEPGKTIMIPSINIDEQAIKENITGIPVPYFEGAHMMKNEQYLGYLSIDDLKGFILSNNESKRYFFGIKEEDLLITVELKSPKLKLKPIKSGEKTAYKLEVTIPSILRANESDLSTEEVKKKLENAIEQEISLTINSAREIGADPFQLEDNLFRFHHAEWMERKDSSEAMEPEEIEVTLKPFTFVDKTN